ncbi:MAG TPA: Lrp/AsnC family transcriptional regulator [Thermoplasmata archaeon]|jgi:Lrp/AsnC family transcriptional regulator for asnA, asnC and gidA|nr:Lrp/AsnC family transcriptional regulator [Thermoplasmata archaeon]
MAVSVRRRRRTAPKLPDEIERPDRIILERLQKDAKMNLSALAKMTGLASSSVHYRIKRLEDEQVIKGYTAVVDPSKLGYDILAVSFVRSRYDPKSYERLSKALPRIPGVWACYFLLGDTDYVILIRAKNRADLNRIVYKLISMRDIERSDTRIVIERLKEDISVVTT